ncbi:HesB/YadR/YfhF family protein [Paenibacillus oenotherae]|uniref:HesB/YadR/YfhF family protein n=1 Tax=Paenibacillus oenotherae TaxID=1435645 RepID=A0ABS7DB10_9BACL|nr:HesB/YadR/YfhF family protein [Paenibacillus oenotherae]MBW7477107.1 HesB/YadR/YfhF family protein [Paenibacillus oenotherae]
MRLLVEGAAADWYKREMLLQEGDHVRIFVRLGGCGSVQPGFSLGVMKDVPRNAALHHIAAGIDFYMEEDNLWYLDNKKLIITLDEQENEIVMEVKE